jgi:hypothetical protein
VTRLLELPPALAGWLNESFYGGFSQTLCIIYLAKAGFSCIHRHHGLKPVAIQFSFFLVVKKCRIERKA